MSKKRVTHWCKSYNPKPNASGNCGDCYNYNVQLGYCPKNFVASNDLVHPPVRARKKSSRVTMVLR